VSSSALPVDVVIVTWNSQEMVLRCLDHLAHARVERVVVVDNASTDGTPDAVRSGYSGVDVLALPKEEGLARAYNQGATQGSARFVLFLNDDVLIYEGALGLLVAALQERPAAVAAAGRLVGSEDGITQAEYLPQRFPTPNSLVAMLAGCRRRPQALSESQTVVVDQPPGAFLLVRREVFDAIGGWDENFEFWYEDVDLARRLQARGDVLYVPSAYVGHVGGHSARRLSRPQVVSRHYRGALLYAHKHFRRSERIATGLLYALTGAVKLLFLRDRAARRAYRSVLRNGLRVAAGRAPLAS
jgi:N-acetylglucosaminyl-diphospho-decaprenol L-rhamnosyltransferase